MKNSLLSAVELSHGDTPHVRAEVGLMALAQLGAALMFCGAVGLAGLAQRAAAATEAGDAVPGSATPRNATRQLGESPLDRRIALLAAEMSLNPVQQRQVRALLLRQRESVQQTWGDPNLPPAIRVSRTQAISDRTADDIRALLDDEQRKKYIQPRQREAAVGNAGASVEAWTARAPSAP